MATSAATRAHPQTGRRRLHRTDPLVATPEDHRTEVARGRDALRFPDAAARGAPVPTVAPDGTQRGTAPADGDIGEGPNAPRAPTEGDLTAALHWWRHQRGDAPRLPQGGRAPADRPRVTSSQRFTGGDTGVASHRGRRRAGRTLRPARRDRTGAPPEVATPRAPSVSWGRMAASALKEVATPPDARLRSSRSFQVRLVDAALGSPKGHQVTVTVACYRASANPASVGRVAARSPPRHRTSRSIEGSSAGSRRR